MILAATRRVVTGTERLRKNPSEFKKLKKELFSVEIEGKTLGIIGTGRIGSSLAVKAKALGMKTIGYDAYIKQSGVIDLQSSIDKVFEKADYISLHLPLTDETRHMISDEAFEKMKTNVVLINCARGGVVDEEAAYRALEKGKLAVYATDVFEKEPPKEENKLLKHPNVIMTPHIGAQTLEGNYRASVQVAEKVIEALKELK